MLALDKRIPDTQYRDLLELILTEGKRVRSRQGPAAYRIIGPPPMRFRLENGFPIITERSVRGFWRAPIGEICAFINGIRTLAELERFGVKWWSNWATLKKCASRGLPAGDLGPGSYGAAFTNFPMPGGDGFNQFQHLVEQVTDEPELRTHFISPWIPYYNCRGRRKIQKTVVSPCHGWIHVFSDPDGKMTLHMWQRSADFPVGVPSNMIQYSALLMMIAQVTRYKAEEFVHSFSDAHIYENQIPMVRVMLTREPRAFPTVNVRSRDNLFDFRAEDFELSDYNPHPPIKNIPVAV